MNRKLPIFGLLSLSLSFLLVFAAALGAVQAPQPSPEDGFNGTFAVLPGGQLEMSMGDGSRILLGPGPVVDPRAIGKSDQVLLRRDLNGRVIFAADPTMALIYTFRFSRDGSKISMTDPRAMVSEFTFDGTTGKVTGALLPSGKRLRFP